MRKYLYFTAIDKKHGTEICRVKIEKRHKDNIDVIKCCFRKLIDESRIKNIKISRVRYYIKNDV